MIAARAGADHARRRGIADEVHGFPRHTHPGLDLGTDGDPLDVRREDVAQKSVALVAAVVADGRAEKTAADAEPQRARGVRGGSGRHDGSLPTAGHPGHGRNCIREGVSPSCADITSRGGGCIHASNDRHRRSHAVSRRMLAGFPGRSRDVAAEERYASHGNGDVHAEGRQGRGRREREVPLSGQARHPRTREG